MDTYVTISKNIYHLCSCPNKKRRGCPNTPTYIIGKFLSDSELLTSDIAEGNLFEQLEKIIEVLRTKYLHSYIIIANMFYKTGFVESWGKGTNNIIDDCLKMGLPEPEYRYTFHSVQVIFYKATQKEKNEGVNEEVKQLLEHIYKNPSQRSPFFAQKLNTSVKNIERWLKQLKEEDKIEFQGSPKMGGYFVKQKM